MADFKTIAKEFHQKILQHWRVETYAVNEVRKYPYITYKEPFSIKYFSMPIKIKKCFLLVKP